MLKKFAIHHPKCWRRDPENVRDLTLKLQNLEDQSLFTTPNIGSDLFDSDITGEFGEGTSDVISLESGDTITNIDAGLILALTIGDFVWEDINGDGIQQSDEPGISGVTVNISNSGGIVSTTQTDTDGL